jgi:uncharacterized membrane protein
MPDHTLLRRRGEMWPFRKRSRSLFDDWEREDARQKENVEQSMARQDVQTLLDALNLGVQDIQELHDRLKRMGLSDRQIRKALRDTEILRWYFSILPSDKKITFRASMELRGWLIRKGIV